jgi:hypothetical protein
MVGCPAFSQKWRPARVAKRIETVTTFRNGVLLASKVPGRPLQSANTLGAIWAKVLDPAMIDRSTSDWTVAEDADRLLKYGRHEMGHGG